MTGLFRFIPLLLTLFLIACASSPESGKTERRSKEAAEVNAELGLRYMMDGEYALSMQKLQRALKFNPESVSANHYIAELYRRLEKYEEADRYFRIALDHAEKDYSLLNNYGVFLCNQGRIDEAEEQFIKVLDDPLYRARDQLYENMGLCMLDGKNQNKDEYREKAESYLRKALSINPRLPKSLIGMTQLSYENGKYMSARAYLQRYLEVGNQTPETLWLGIKVERILGNKNAVASYGMQLKGRFPESEEARQYLETIKQ